MGTIKDRNCQDLAETEEIRKRWQEYTEELNKIGLNDLDNQDGVVTNQELDIMEYEVKWALKYYCGQAVPRWQRNRMGRPLSPPQIHQKIICMCSNFYKTTFDCWWRTPDTQKGYQSL